MQILTDGYRICAGCGAVMLNGDTAIVTPRGQRYLVYTHPDCRGAVPGWKTIRRAERIQAHKQRFTLRLAAHPCEFAGMNFPACMCTLDNESLFVPVAAGEERDANYEPTYDPVWYQPSDEAPLPLSAKATADGISKTFDRLSRNSLGYHTSQRTADTSGDEPLRPVRRIATRNFTEEDFITVLDIGLSRCFAVIERDVIGRERARSYASGCRVSVGSDHDYVPPLMVVLTRHDPTEIHPTRRKWVKSPLSKLHQGPMHTRDANGRVVEWALYAGSQLERYLPPGEPLALPFNFQTHPEHYERIFRRDSWDEVKAYTESWLPYPIYPAYSRPFRLKREIGSLVPGT